MLLLQTTVLNGGEMMLALSQAELLAKQLRMNVQVNFYANSVVISPTTTPAELKLAYDKFQKLYPDLVTETN